MHEIVFHSLSLSTFVGESSSACQGCLNVMCGCDGFGRCLSSPFFAPRTSDYSENVRSPIFSEAVCQAQDKVFSLS
ncbi:hypothetical protein D1AOALGA4SA_3249 [Olavius algarvensis Delta 1 endosymbiont]|nr:hypothetical protein D1AOALGA4SA_3249 [Olavius algarvensis Delta 1 endosymbiont]